MSNTPAARQEILAVQSFLGLKSDTTLTKGLADVVFVCVDCEAYEHDHHKVTEIGIASLDTKGSHGEKNAASWISKMTYAHYRIIEHADLVNRRYVKGREEYFNFGSTTWIHLADAKTVLHRVFLDPASIEHAARFAQPAVDQGRAVVLVGHSLRNDKSFLKDVDFALEDASNVTRIIDTEVVAGKTKKRGVSLPRLLASVPIETTNLHNAGNDAAYTLQALISVAAKDYKSPGSVAQDVARLPSSLPPSMLSHEKAPVVFGGTATGMSEHT